MAGFAISAITAPMRSATAHYPDMLNCLLWDMLGVCATQQVGVCTVINY
jgi:hypothetical protein